MFLIAKGPVAWNWQTAPNLIPERQEHKRLPGWGGAVQRSRGSWQCAGVGLGSPSLTGSMPLRGCVSVARHRGTRFGAAPGDTREGAREWPSCRTGEWPQGAGRGLALWTSVALGPWSRQGLRLEGRTKRPLQGLSPGWWEEWVSKAATSEEAQGHGDGESSCGGTGVPWGHKPQGVCGGFERRR